MQVPGSGRDETYAWLGSFPGMREWLGARVINNFLATSFVIANRLFESTVRIGRNDIEDDRLGTFGSVFANMGQLAKRHPEELVFGLLAAGFTTNCHDRQFFFDTDHSVEIAGVPTAVSNMQAGAGTPGFLPDCSSEIRPIVWQARSSGRPDRLAGPIVWQEPVPHTFESPANPGDGDLFMANACTRGVRARVTCGFGRWQPGFGSGATLDAINHAAARAAPMASRSDNGRIPGVTPTHLVVPPALEAAARALLNTEYGTGGISNPWQGTAEPIVTP